MTDAEAEGFLPHVSEFVDAVRARDRDHVASCLMFTPAEVFAVLCADLLISAREEIEKVRAEYERLVKFEFGRDIRPAGMTLSRAMDIVVDSENRKESR